MLETLPNVFLIGAQKSGTTYLAALLDQSPNICVSSPKEPQLLSGEYKDGPRAYEGLFQNLETQYRMDASTTYSFLRSRAQMHLKDAPGLLAPVPQRIKAICPDPKIIYILRDPVERAVSALRHKYRMKAAPKNEICLIEAMESDPMLTHIGLYGQQIERYLEEFPLDNILLINFQDLQNRPLEVLETVAKFLTISASQIIPSKPSLQSKKHKAHQFTPLGKFVTRLVDSHPVIKSVSKNIIPKKFIYSFVNSAMKTQSKLTFLNIEEAREYFVEDLKYLKELTGFQL